MDLDARLVNVLSTVLQIPASDVNENTSPETAVSWDSIRSMMLVVALEEEFAVEFTDQETLEMISYKLIKETLQQKGIS